MHKTLYAGAAAAALLAGPAFAEAHLVFAPGEGNFSWDSYEAYKANGFKLADETVPPLGPPPQGLAF